jgi:hypothetical protein
MGRFKALFPRLPPTLHGLAGAWRDAANIRAYVDAARQSAGGNMVVFEIARRDAGEAHTAIASTFGVSHTTIGRL